MAHTVLFAIRIQELVAATFFSLPVIHIPEEWAQIWGIQLWTPASHLILTCSWGNKLRFLWTMRHYHRWDTQAWKSKQGALHNLQQPTSGAYHHSLYFSMIPKHFSTTYSQTADTWEIVLPLWKGKTHWPKGKKTSKPVCFLMPSSPRLQGYFLLEPGKPNHPLLMSWNSLLGSTARFGLESEDYIQRKLHGRSRKDNGNCPALEFGHGITMISYSKRSLR